MKALLLAATLVCGASLQAQTNQVSLRLAWTDTNTPDSYIILQTTNLALPVSSWTIAGSVPGNATQFVTVPYTPSVMAFTVTPSNLWVNPNGWTTNIPVISNVLTTPPPPMPPQNLKASR